MRFTQRTVPKTLLNANSYYYFNALYLVAEGTDILFIKIRAQIEREEGDDVKQYQWN